MIDHRRFRTVLLSLAGLSLLVFLFPWYTTGETGALTHSTLTLGLPNSPWYRVVEIKPRGGQNLRFDDLSPDVPEGALMIEAATAAGGSPGTESPFHEFKIQQLRPESSSTLFAAFSIGCLVGWSFTSLQSSVAREKE